MDFETQAFYFNLCKPWEALAPNDPRNVDVDALGSPEERVRGLNWAERLAFSIRLAQGSQLNPVQSETPTSPICHIFTGLPGSGKSTELLRLAERLAHLSTGHRFLPVYIDAEEHVDLRSPIDLPDIRLSILLRVEEAVLRAEGKAAQDAAAEGPLTRLWNRLSRSSVPAPRLEFGVTGAKLVAEMKANPSLRQQVRQHVAAQVTSFIEEVDRELVELNARARACGYAALVVLFDSLEKLRGISTNWHDVLASAERLFAGGAPYLRLPIHVLYTIPPAVALRLNLSDLSFIPMIKLASRDGVPFPAGLEAMRSIVRQRVPDEILAELFGATQVEQRLSDLIIWSGGYPRDLIRLLQEVLKEQRFPLSDGTLKRILSMAGDRYRVIVPDSAVEWLARVAVTHLPNTATEEQREAADFLLSNNVVLRYQNESEWFDVHPAMRSDPRLAQAIASLQARQG